MESPEYNSLPIILVSAKDSDSAKAVITTIVDNEPEMSIEDKPDNDSKHAWRLVNKYYSADVRFHILPDGEELNPELRDHIEAHLIYLTETEALDNIAVDVIERRMYNGKDADVRVIVVDSEVEDNTLVSAATPHHYELIPLRAPVDYATSEPNGLERVRAAFHAHVWANMKTNTPLPHLQNGDGADSDSDSWSSWQGGEERREGETEEQFMQRAEAFAEALGSLPEAVAHVRGCNGNRTMRIARAEMVISAFCNALGAPFDFPLEYDNGI